MTQTRPSAASSSSRAAGRRRAASPPARLARFFREVVAELTKVIWPTRTDLITYTVVVIFFVALMIAIVAGLDFGFAKAVVEVFG